MSDLNQDCCKLAKEVAKEVGKKLKDVVFNNESVKISQKGEVDLVTEMDLWAEEQIETRIKSSYSDHNIVGEESFSASSSNVEHGNFSDLGISWVIDPIDGTTNFAHKIPHFGISIALLIDGVRQVGVVYDPCKDEMYSAIKGQGAFCNEKPISVSKELKLINSVIVTGYPYNKQKSWPRYQPLHEYFVRNSRAMRRFGACSLDCCWIACGRFDAYYEYTLKPWDVAAGSLIIEEAGGMCGNFAVDDDHENYSVSGHGFLGAGANLFPEMFELTKKLDAEAVKEVQR